MKMGMFPHWAGDPELDLTVWRKVTFWLLHKDKLSQCFFIQGVMPLPFCHSWRKCHVDVGEQGSAYRAETVWWVMIVLLKCRLDSILRATEGGAQILPFYRKKTGSYADCLKYFLLTSTILTQVVKTKATWWIKVHHKYSFSTSWGKC